MSGRTFYDFWTRYKAATTKPLLITEYGVDSYIEGQSTEEGEKQQAEWEMDMWAEIEANNDVVSGGLKFAFEDGWFKCSGGSISVQEKCPVDGGNRFPGGQVNEEYFGMVSYVNTVPDPNYADEVRVKETYCKFKNAWKNYPSLTSIGNVLLMT